MNFKKNTFLLFFLLLGSFYFLEAQKPVNMSFFDRSGELSTLAGAYYYRATTDTIDYYRSYYASDSSIYFQGKIISARDSSDKKNSYAGLCSWYYNNGVKKMEYNYNDKGIFNGLCIDYFENGKPKKIIDYANGLPKNNMYNEYGSNGAEAFVFEEDFISNRNNWLLSNSDTGTVKIKIGGLEFISKKTNGFVRAFSKKINEENYSIEAFINSNYLLDSAKAGIVLGMKDKTNYSYFLISKHNCFIGSVKNGKDQKRIYGFYCYSLKGYTSNRVKVICFNNKLFYSINDEVLFSEEAPDLLEKTTGLCIASTGNALFDKLLIREYKTDLIIEPIDPKIKNENIYFIANKDYGVQSVSAGIFLNKQGLILTNAKNFHHYNQIIVEAIVNDSAKQFFADVLIKDENANIALLKIKDAAVEQFSEIAYSFFNKDLIDIESDLYTIYYTKSDTNSNAPKIVEGKLKSKARYENLSTSFDTSLKTEQLALGGPVFTKEGELLGTINLIDNKTRATKLGAIENLLFISRQKFEKPKKHPNPQTSGAISKNVVLIKVK